MGTDIDTCSVARKQSTDRSSTKTRVDSLMPQTGKCKLAWYTREDVLPRVPRKLALA